MITITYYNMLSLPNVSCYFQLEYLNGKSDKPVSAGDKVLFLMLKRDEKEGHISAEDIYPIATRGVVERVEDEWALVRTTSRVDLDAIQSDGKHFQVQLRTRPELNDLDLEEQQERFQKMREAMLDALEGTQWLMGARNYIMRWSNMNELIAFTSSMLQISNEEKFAILAEDSVARRAEKMEKAFYESLELFKVNKEAQTAQKENNEQLYREQAIRKQIDFLQDELDKLHPENVTDVQKF